MKTGIYYLQLFWWSNEHVSTKGQVITEIFSLLKFDRILAQNWMYSPITACAETDIFMSDGYKTDTLWQVC